MRLERNTMWIRGNSGIRIVGYGKDSMNLEWDTMWI